MRALEQEVFALNEERGVRQVAATRLPTRWGEFRMLGFERDTKRGVEEAVALVMGNPREGAPLVRIHSQCLTGDVFGSERCDCGAQLELAMQLIAAEGTGVLIYEKQEGRGIGLMSKLRAYSLQDGGLDTVEANEHLGYPSDLRDFALPVAMLRRLGVQRLRLLTNNPAKSAAVAASGIKVQERVPCEVTPRPSAERYMLTKKQKMGHSLTRV
jgi:GTP cyclohydrolase II